MVSVFDVDTAASRAGAAREFSAPVWETLTAWRLRSRAGGAAWKLAVRVSHHVERGTALSNGVGVGLPLRPQVRRRISVEDVPLFRY